jgi:hypothetical protein
MAKHTPGPWVATPVAGLGGHFFAIHQPEFDNNIAELDCSADDEEAAANARLIAAAPELLAACQRLLNTCGLSEDIIDEMDVEAIELARAAIAKATS